MSKPANLPAPESQPRPSLIGRAHAVSENQGRRKTIAVLLDYMNFYGGGYEGRLRSTFDAKCRELDLDLLLVFGRAIGEPRASSAAHNLIFDLMRGDFVDGIVVISTVLSAHVGEAGMAEFVQRFDGRPLVSFGVALPGIPSVLVDNGSAMESVVEHMITEHGARKLAFIAGTPDNPEAVIRLRAFQTVLARHGLPYDEALVENGYFMKSTGYTAMQRILARGVAIDAVIAANDGMALGAIEALRLHGMRVPVDVRVTGFDDLTLARLGNPPLTTVAQPFEAMVDRAIALLLEQGEGGVALEHSAFPGEVMVRQSCGCGYGVASKRRVADRAPVRDVAFELDTRRAEIQSSLAARLRVGTLDGSMHGARLIEALRAEVSGKERAFIRELEQVLDEVREDNERYRALQAGISCLRSELLSVRTPELDDLWHEALGVITLANTTAQVHHRLAMDESYVSLLGASEQASVALDVASLGEALERSLPLSGVKTAFLSRYVDESCSELEQFVGLLDGVPIKPAKVRFDARRIFPPGSACHRRRSSAVFPLAFEAQALGVAVFDYTLGANGHHVLRDQISAALRNVFLHQEMVEKTMLHERSVQERAATARRMQSLSVLAGGVAHDLNNVLGPIVALPDVILRELEALGLAGSGGDELVQDLESIKSAALRASQTIKDLLTLGRQGRAAKETIDLNQAVAASLTPEVLRFIGRANSRVEVQVELASRPLVVRASEAHVMRALNNLVRNAVEAMPADGKVLVRTFAARVSEPISGYETIDPGDYAVVAVSDRGDGIAAHELTQIFEPFFSKKRIGDNSGTGLGLAIVHGVVKEHDGFVDVESGLGSGTTFTLYFPSSDAVIEIVEPVHEATRGRATVLIVDDEPVQLRAGRRVLTQLGYRVETLASGRRAREAFLQAKTTGGSPYDLVILDMALNEEHDGLQLFEQIRELFPDQKAIIASGHAPNERIELAIGHGLAWLPKPYTADALASAVHTALAERPSLRAVKRSSCPSPTAAVRR